MRARNGRLERPPVVSVLVDVDEVMQEQQRYPDDVVMQLHPARSDYVNNHNFCLHLWRPQGQTIPTPPVKLLGTR